jgi:hypothetical protein
MAGDCGDVLAYWRALRARGLARQLLCVFGSLEDLEDGLREPVQGCRVYLADALAGLDPDAGAILRDNDRLAGQGGE